jgi:hypothetical protein
MRELIIERIKAMTSDAKYGSMRWDALYEHLNEGKKLSKKALREAKVFDLFDFTSISDSKTYRIF